MGQTHSTKPLQQMNQAYLLCLSPKLLVIPQADVAVLNFMDIVFIVGQATVAQVCMEELVQWFYFYPPIM